MKLSLTFACGVLAVFAYTVSARASDQTFDLTWSGASFNNTAVATGVLTMDPSVLTSNGYNDNSGLFFAPNPFVSALTITVSGATVGNGVFNLSDFITILMNQNLNAGSLDFGTELVGQATSGDPWGTPSGNGGDFNVLTAEAGAPQGASIFTMATAGGAGDSLRLISFAPEVIPQTPEPGSLALFAAGVLPAVTCLCRRRRRMRLS